jgi:hypothetical protein
MTPSEVHPKLRIEKIARTITAKIRIPGHCNTAVLMSRPLVPATISQDNILKQGATSSTNADADPLARRLAEVNRSVHHRGSAPGCPIATLEARKRSLASINTVFQNMVFKRRKSQSIRRRWPFFSPKPSATS